MKGCNCGCGMTDPVFRFEELESWSDIPAGVLPSATLGADWQDFATKAVQDPGPTEEPEDDDRMRCDCCDQAFDDGDLNEDQVCAECEEEGRLEREHQRFESRSSLFL